jgi:undecaprenyl-diphosphatase
MLELQNFDSSATALINGFSGYLPFLDTTMIAIAGFGLYVMVLAVAVQWWSGPDRTIKRHVLIAAGMAFFLGLAINQLLLLEFNRLRPYVDGISALIVPQSEDPSFPSDNATVGFAIAATFVLAKMRKQAFWFSLAAVALALSRVFVGLHYVGDIVGGAVTGIIAALVVSILFKRYTRIDRVLTEIL